MENERMTQLTVGLTRLKYDVTTDSSHGKQFVSHSLVEFILHNKAIRLRKLGIRFTLQKLLHLALMASLLEILHITDDSSILCV